MVVKDGMRVDQIRLRNGDVIERRWPDRPNGRMTDWNARERFLTKAEREEFAAAKTEAPGMLRRFADMMVGNG